MGHESTRFSRGGMYVCVLDIPSAPLSGPLERFGERFSSADVLADVSLGLGLGFGYRIR